LSESDGLRVERMGDETLVYDSDNDRAHLLSGLGADAFRRASDDVSRREVLRRLTIASAAASGAAPLLKSIAVPTAAQAQSNPCPGATNGACATSQFCCGLGTTKVCCASASECCGNNDGSSAFCCTLPTICCVTVSGTAQCCDTSPGSGMVCDNAAGCISG
jgi:hypothetical protein